MPCTRVPFPGHPHLERGWLCVPASTRWPSPATKWPPRPQKHLEAQGNGHPVDDVTSMCLLGHMHQVTKPDVPSGVPGLHHQPGQQPGQPRVAQWGGEDSPEDLAERTSWRWPRPAGAGKSRPSREVTPPGCHLFIPRAPRVSAVAIWPVPTFIYVTVKRREF